MRFVLLLALHRLRQGRCRQEGWQGYARGRGVYMDGEEPPALQSNSGLP